MVTRSLLIIGLSTLLFGFGFGSFGVGVGVAGIALLALAFLVALIELIAPQ